MAQTGFRIASFVLLSAMAACAPRGKGGTHAIFDLASAHDTPATFWDQPFPSDLRLTSTGAPDMTGFYVKAPGSIGDQVRESIAYRRGWAQMPIAWFRFDGALADRVETDAIAAAIDAPFLLVDVDASSAERGMLFPVVAKTLVPDSFAPAHLLALAPHPGIVLREHTRYAFVVRAAANDAAGAPLHPASVIAARAAGKTPAGANGAALAALDASLWETLDTIGVARTGVVNATVFTTGDVVGDLASLSTGLIAKHPAAISNPRLDPDDGAHPDFCEVKIDLSLPQFVTGTEPWNTEGRFVLGTDGLPVKQGDRVVPAVLTIPRAAMPATGFPLLLYLHGTAGVHDEVVDASKSTVTGVDGPKGEGPAMWYAREGVAAAGSALPVSPDRVPGAGELTYLNFANLGNFTFLFRQGVIEQRMYLGALLGYHLPTAVLSSCAGVTLPGGATDVFFDPDRVFVGGQSQGGMYTNFIGAVDPRPKGFIPTGAGGLWNLMIVTSSQFADQLPLIGNLLGTNETLTFLHPSLGSFALAWETSEPVVFAPHLGRRPLPGYPVRPVYEPVGRGDRYFGAPIYDAISTAYGNKEAGDVLWDSMQSSLALEGLDGIVPYPVSNDVISETGVPYTGVVVQYDGDGIVNAHAIYRQRDEVIFQYRCFLRSLIDTGTAVVPAPAPLGSACP